MSIVQSIVLLIIASSLVLCDQTCRLFDFKQALYDAGLQSQLTHPHPLHIETLDPAKCHQYNVHVQRWEYSLTRYPVGISCKCDWIMTQNAFYGTTMEPKIVFVATRALISFVALLDTLKHPIVLITSINDETIPVNHDTRIRMPEGFTENPNHGLWPRILHHPMIIHWFLENHSQVDDPKVSTLPIMFVSKTGTTEPDEAYEELMQYYTNAPLWQDRPTLLLSSDRVRDGRGQWADRAIVYKLCLNNSLCTVAYHGSHGADQDMSEWDSDNFAVRVSNSKFLIMAHGGGLDPCPKLVHSIVLGTIPIIQSNALDDAYEQLPVVIVPSLSDFLDPAKTDEAKALLEQWGEKYSPYYEPFSQLRADTLYKLSEEYWWNQVLKYKPP